MKTLTNQLFSDAEFNKMRAEGYVRVNVHPEDPELFILNYTEKAAFEGVWNDVTLNCRGLIVDAGNWIVARPFPKFFNYGQAGCPVVDLDEPTIVSDKMDGSLGILYRDHDTGKYNIATRGSFTSDQAIHATDVLRTKYADFKPLPGYTYLFEIIYPENRIVCDYAGMDDLVLLGGVEIDTGDTWDAYFFANNWPGPRAEAFEYQTMREALQAKPRAGAEGFVVHLLESDVRVKIKQEDYIALHRIVTGLNARSVWQAMVDDKLDELIEQIPDEFHGFINDVATYINDEINEDVAMTYRTYKAIVNDILPDNAVKRDFAEIAKPYSYAWALFKIWDSVYLHDIRKEFLKRAKPAHDLSPIKVSNESD